MCLTYYIIIVFKINVLLAVTSGFFTLYVNIVLTEHVCGVLKQH